RRDDLKIKQSLAAHSSDLLQIAATGDADHQGREDERRDNRLDQIEEDVAEKIDVVAPVITPPAAEVSNQTTEYQPDQNLRGQGRPVPGTSSNWIFRFLSHERLEAGLVPPSNQQRPDKSGL